MANRNIDKIKLKRSNVLGKIPTLGQLELGEIALNTADAKLYTEYTGGASGSTDVREIGWNRVNVTGDTMTGTLYGPSISATTIDGGNILSGGTNISTLFSTTDYYTTGSTLINNTLYFHRNDSLSAYTVDLSSISGGGGGGGHEIYSSTGATALTQREKLRFTGYLSATDDNINQETIIELDETQLTNFNSTDIIDINGTFKLSLEEDHLYFGNVQGLAEQKTLNEIFDNASKIVGTIFIVGVDNKLQLNVPQGYIIRGNSNGEGVAEPLISGANKTLITDSNGNEVEADLVSFFDLLTATSVTANGVLNTIDLSGTARGILGGWKITDIVVKNTTANVVTINIGSSPGGTNVVNGAEIPANGFIELPIGTTLFSETVEQSLNVSSGNWNSANLIIKFSVKKVF